MAKAFRIIGGMSLPGRISIISETHVAVARRGRDGIIRCTVTKRPRAVTWIASHPNAPLPKTIRLLALIFADLGWRKLVAIALVLGGCVGFIVADEAASASLPGSILMTFFKQLLFLAFVWMIMRVRPWHAAEHKVIGAWEAGASAPSMELIITAYRISPRCGARFILPLLLADCITAFTLYALETETILAAICAIFLMFETVFWIESLVGWWNVPGFRAASVLIQRYITTCEPETKHLATAKCALDALIDAANHERNAS